MIQFMQVAGTAVILEVQRSSKSEARKEALRKQELEVKIYVHFLLEIVQLFFLKDLIIILASVIL